MEFIIKKYNDDYYRLIAFKYGNPNNYANVSNEYMTYEDVPRTIKEFDETYTLCDENGNILSDRLLFTKKKKHLKRERNINENKLENNLSRAKSKIFQYAMCNDFEYFVTLTLDSKKYDRYNLKKFVSDLGHMIRNNRARKGWNLQYILIPEQHKDGAWHLHGLFSHIPSEFLEINKNGYLDFPQYSKKFGYCSLSKIKDKNKCASYITKYVSKDLGDKIEKNHKCYYASRGLKLPVKVFCGNLDKEIKFDFENDFVQLKNMNELEFCKFINNYTF